MKVTVELDEDEKKLPPRELVTRAIDPEVDAYGRWLAERDKKGALSSFERDVIRSYLWFRSGR